MPLKDDSQPHPQRRRGAALEVALLDAAWQELLEAGYDAFTYDAVAARAATSRAVLYRRWPTKPELARAAVERGLLLYRAVAPDTGSLRDDVIGVLKQLNEARIRVGIAVIGRLGPYFESTGTTIGDIRDSLVDGRGSTMDIVLERAIDRGEIAPGTLSPRVASLPLDLFRHEMLTTLRPVPHETITEIVDDVFMPLIAALNTGKRSPNPNLAQAKNAEEAQ